MKQKFRMALKIALPLVILIAAGAIAFGLSRLREEPAREAREFRGTLVETRVVREARERLQVKARGTVTASRQVNLLPQVSGRLIWVDEDLVPGGVVRKGDVLAIIEPADYQISVEEQETALAQARAQLEIEEGLQEVARKEWELFKDEGDVPEADPSLALREPQLKSARVAVKAAEQRLKRAKLNLARTRIEAPFNALVRNESAQIGSLVSAQTPIGTIVGTDRYRVRVSLPVDELSFVDIPSVNAEEGSEATLSQEIGSERVERKGRVSRMLPDLDPAGRMARLLIEVEDPMRITEAEGNQPRGLPLLIDAYVDVLIEGGRELDLVAIPREAIHNGDEAFVLRDGKLAVQKVDIVWRRENVVLVRSGVKDGEEVVVSEIPSAMEGMKLRKKTEVASRPSGEARK